MSNKNLYQNTTYFKLIIGETEYFIDEPQDWDKISIQNVRDKQFIGFNESYVDDKTQLGFASDKKANESTNRAIVPAYPLIKAVYEADAGDGDAVLEFGIVDSITGDLRPQYSGNLNFNTYHDEDSVITCSVEKLNFDDLFRTRNDTSINLASTTTLDNEAMDAIPMDSIKLRAKLLSKQFTANVTSPETAESGEIARFVNVQPDTSAPQVSELEEGEGLPLGISGIDPRDEQRYFFKVIEEGSYKFKFDVSFNFQIVKPSVGGVGTFALRPRWMIQRPNVAKATVNLSAGQISGGQIIGAVLTGGGAGYTFVTVDITGDGAGATAIAAIAGGVIQSITITNPGSGYTNATVSFTGDGAGATATISDGEVTGLTVDSGGSGYTVANVEIVGDGTGATATATLTGGVVTAFTVTNAGTGYTNAKAIITGDAEIATIEYTFFDAFGVSGTTPGNSASFLMSCDINFTRDLLVGDLLYFDFNGTQQFAGASYYYYVTNYTSNISITAQTSTPDSFTNAYRLIEAVSGLMLAATGQVNNLLSSVLDVGGRAYNYHITNGYQIRGFDTGFKPPITSIKDAFNSICNIFGLGYTFTRRAGITKLLVEDVSYFFKDAEIARLPNTTNNYYEEHAADLTFNDVITGYEKYPTLSTANGTGNTLDEFNTYHEYLLPIKTAAATFTKKSTWIASGYALETQRREQFKDNPSQSLTNDDDIFIIATEMVDDTIQSEADENFENVTGLLSPDTAYNLRITPARILFNWSPYLGIGLAKKDPAKVIINNLAVDNNTLVSKLKSDDLYKQYEPSFPVNEGGSLTIAQLNEPARKALHLPTYSFFKSEIKYDLLISIIDALTFSAETDQDGGYIVYNDDKGQLWKGYPYSIKYNPYTEEAEFQCAKKGIY